MKRLFFVPFLLLASGIPAIAGVESWSSQSGKTEFLMPLVNACSSPRQPKPSSYETEYQNIKYTGILRVDQVSGCRTAQTTIYGSFEEKNQLKGEWCSGKLTLRFAGSRGSATWENIRSVGGYNCKGAGKSFLLPLIQTGP